MSFWPSPLYVTKKDETILTITGAKHRARVEEVDIMVGESYQDDPVSLTNAGNQSLPNSMAPIGIYVGYGKSLNAGGSESSTPAVYASDKITHTLRQREIDRSMYVWYDSPTLVRADVTTVSGSVTLSMGSTTGLIVGMTVAGTGIPTGSTIVSINANGTTFVISQPCTASATVTGTFTGNIVGECAVVDYVDASGSLPTYIA